MGNSPQCGSLKLENIEVEIQASVTIMIAFAGKAKAPTQFLRSVPIISIR